jgi:hypothetical protein
MVELEPDAVGIFEQNRVISRRPLILARRTDDLGAERLEEAVQLIDVGALAGAEAEVVQADALLVVSVSITGFKPRNGSSSR